MTLALTYPDPESLVVAYLSDHLTPGATVSTLVPDVDWQATASEYVVVNASGPGEVEHMLDQVHYGITCYGPTTTAAATRAAEVRHLLTLWPQRAAGVYRYRTLARPQYAPDDTRYPAYWLSCSLRVRGY